MGRTRKSPASLKRLPPKVHIESRQKDLKLQKASIRQAVLKTLEFLQVFPEEIAIYLVSEKEIADLHERFFQDPTPTDCISFPLDPSFLGEIFVCPKVAIDYSTPRGLDAGREVLLYIIHGILHLVGYDDLTPQGRREMRKMEKRCLKNLTVLASSAL